MNVGCCADKGGRAEQGGLLPVADEHILLTSVFLFVVISQLEALRANWLERAAVLKKIPALAHAA
jgi:hypothetical protein